MPAARRRTARTDSVSSGARVASALLVGRAAAQALALRLDIPRLAVNHLEGHLCSLFLDPAAPRLADALPFVTLIVSGGHTQLVRVEAPGQYRLLGQTLDDAAGEALDKGAKLLGLGYPGGPLIERAAQGGDPRRIGVFGSSAGGHLAVLAAAMPDPPFACAVSWGAPMDLRDAPLAASHRGYLLAFLNDCPHDAPARYADASPVHWIGPHSAPILLLHGDDDALVPPRQPDLLAAAAPAHVEVVHLPNSPHVPDHPSDPGIEEGWRHIERFLAAHFVIESDV